MTSKYGVPLTDDAWSGLPLRVGHWPREGKLEGLVAGADAVLVWGGGTSDVDLYARTGQPVQRHRFVRKSGMLDFLPKDTLLERVAWQGQSSDCISIIFDAQRIEQLLGKPAALDPEGLRFGVTDAHVVDLARRLQAQALAKQPWGPLYVEGLSLALTSYVYGRYGRHAGPGHGENSLPALQSERLVAFVEDRLGAHIGLAELAELVGYSPDHFARLFKRSFGVSPYQYILERRVERAKALLRDRAHSVVEVAVTCGFASQAHFHTTFKARTGVTPGVFRKS